LETLVISFVAFVASLLTLFSGFGLGTLLMPFMGIFVSLELAIAMTAIVHLANNLFKLALLYRHIDGAVMMRFGVSALLFSVVGAGLLLTLGGEWLQFVIGSLILGFVALELYPKFATMSFDSKYLPLGGALSGFFGGLSGHQGAFRSMFLLKSNLSKESFVATGVGIAVMVDVSRLSIYATSIGAEASQIDWALVASATLCAFVGSYFGAKYLAKTTHRFIRYSVSIMLVLIALGMMGGVL
jgi:uncharacterized membrane protein YfcA